MTNKIPWYKQKTTWVAITAVVGAVGGGLTGEMMWADALQVISVALIGLFLRQGVEKAKA